MFNRIIKYFLENRIVTAFLLVGFMLALGQQAAFAAENDSIKVNKKKVECCEDSTVTDHKDPYHKVVKEGGSMQEGLFTVRHIKDDWYLEVHDSLLNRMILAVTRFESVPQGFKKMSGEEVNRSAIYFEQYGAKTLFLKEYVQSVFAKEDNAIGKALKQSAIDPIIYKFEIIGRNPQTKASLINVTKWLNSDNKVTSFNGSDRTILGIGAVQNDRTMIDTSKTYPLNVEIRTLRTYAMTTGKVPASKTGSATVMLNTSVVLLPPATMRPRLADERVGYFNTRVSRYSDHDVPDHDAIISRYRLEPKDPKAYRAGKLVEPKKPIVFYIDPATPKKWAKYLKMGIEDWNVAFEAAGFKNAIQAKDWPNDPTMSLDDARYSIVRYLPSETENAYGPRIVDPRTGEIIEAHICWYHSVMQLLKKWYMVQCGPLDKRAQTMDFPEELMGQLIRFVSSHEVGHSLGLRHNMLASWNTPVEKLRDKKWVEQHGHTASIMDYARFNWVAQPEDKVGERGLFPRINDYDKWAIKWGYQWRPEFKDAYEEKTALRREVTKALENPRLHWVGDEGKGQDPRSQTEDLSDNQMKATEYGIKNLKRVMASLPKWTAQPDGQFDDLEMMYKAVRSQFQRFSGHVQRYVNGRYHNNWPATKNYEDVPRLLQKEAIVWMGRHIIEAPLWLYPEQMVNTLGVDDADEIQAQQSTLLSYLLAPAMLYNMHRRSLRSSNPYPVEEYLGDIFATVWKPINSSDERQNHYRRQVQRLYVQFVGKALNLTEDVRKGFSLAAQNSDAILYAEQHLDKIEQYLKKQPVEGINGQHYQNLLLQIKKIREKYESGK